MELLKDLSDDVLCPITKCIFREPVIAFDGFIYEKSAITTWFASNKTSPMTNKTLLSKEISRCVIIENVVYNYLILHPEKIHERYGQIEIHELKIFSVKNFNSFGSKSIIDIFTNLKISDMEYIMSSMDHNTNVVDGLNMMHNICKYSSAEIIDYVLDYYEEHNLNLECETSNKWKPIHLICKYAHENIEHILNIYIKNNLNLECETERKTKPIHLICKYAQKYIKNILNIYIKNNLDLECDTDSKWKPIHFICLTRDNELINYILYVYEKRSLDIHCKTICGQYPIQIICNNLINLKHVAIRVLNIYVKNNLSLEFYNDKILDTPIHMICNNSHSNKLMHNILNIYIKLDLNCDVINGYGCMPIHNICNNNCSNLSMIKRIFKIYMDKKLNVEYKDTLNGRPIHYICMSLSHNIEIIDWILQYYYNHGLDLCCGCNIDDKINGNNKNEPIHFICKYGNSRVIINTIKFYVKHKLNLCTLNYENMSPLTIIKNRTSINHSKFDTYNKIMNISKYHLRMTNKKLK
jgi:hypothetical protein